MIGISRITEEIFPFAHYLKRKNRLRRRSNSNGILNCQGFDTHSTLPEEQLKDRLKEEHQRAQVMDEKTFKLTLSLSVGLTVVGSMAVPLIKAVSCAVVQIILAISIGASLFYVLAAGLVALGALRTSPSYGYGTQSLLELQQQENSQTYLAEILARQETMNTIRHLRNETAYQALRNGLWLLFTGILIFLTALAYQSLYPSALTI